MTLQNHIIFFIAITTMVCSCDALDELTEFDINQDFETTIHVVLTEDSEGEPVPITETSTIDISSNQEIQDNLELLQNVSINIITFQVDNVIGTEDARITNINLNFANTSITIDDLNLKQSDDNNTIYTINDSVQLNAISNYLENNTNMTITLNATISEAPAQFQLQLTLDTTVTVDVL